MSVQLVNRTKTALVYAVKNESRTTSLLVAEGFRKRHDNVLHAVDKLECPEEFRLLNFKESSYLNEQNKSQPMYEMTRDGFSILAMGFTGKKAMEWKIKFLDAFKLMEQKILNIESAGSPKLLDHIRQLIDRDQVSKLSVKPDGTMSLTLRKHSSEISNDLENFLEDYGDLEWLKT